MTRMLVIGLTGLAILCCHACLLVPHEDIATPSDILPQGIPGTLLLHGGGPTPDIVIEKYLQLAGKENAKLVLIPTASQAADDPGRAKEPWLKHTLASLTVLHTRDRTKANDPEFVKPLREATAVWIGGGDQQRLADAYVGTSVEKELLALLQRGGVIGGTSAGAAIASKLMIAGGQGTDVKLSRGLDLLPGVVIDQHFKARQREGRLSHVVEKHPALVGLGIDEKTALLIRGRDIQVLGDSTVTVLFGPGADRPARKMELKSGSRSDLTMLRRAARGRTESTYPPKALPAIEVPSGSLLIVGGGGMPPEVVQKFIELAGGPEEHFVVLPTSMPDPIPNNSGAFLRRAGIKNVHVIATRKKEELSDPKTLALLDRARAIWFDGGRQWRFVDAYEDTPFLEKIHAVLKRGGVIGGSSAGATIQGHYLCRGSPLGPNEMICEGYERGFCFLPGVAIDQHFTQRNRFADLARLKKQYPQFLGIGLDEATAIVVKGHHAQVIGKNRVCFYPEVPKDDKDFISVASGEGFDLRERKKEPRTK